MARRRGFFAEIAHQSKLADQRQAKLAEQRQRAAARERQASLRRAEQERQAKERAALAAAREKEAALRRAEQERQAKERAVLVAQRASEAERKRLEKEQAAAHAASRQAEVEKLNSELTAIYDRVDTLLEATLAVDHYVDLEKLRQTVDHPTSGRRDLKIPIHNADLDQFIANLGYGSAEAVQEYVRIVLANSVYPEGFSVEHETQFDPETAELSLRVLIPEPSTIPTIKSYRYVKTSDEITPVALSQKDAKERYLGIVQQVTLRSLHEVFEADRRGLIQSISLDVGTRTSDPATGKKVYIPFLAVGASRDLFTDIDLSAVVPAATLEYLGASVSKNPLGLVAANTEGVRRS